MSFSTQDWVSAIGNTSVSQCLLGDGSLPSTISPTEAFYFLAAGFREAQETYNDELTTAGPYMNVMPALAVNSVVVFDSNGNAYQDIRMQANFRKGYTADGYDPPTSNVAI